MEVTACSGGFLVKKNKFLFGKRSSKKGWAPNIWDLVGGRSLKDETPLETLKRETFEEIGVRVLNASLLTSIDVLDENEKEYFKYHIFMITAWKGKASNCSNEHTQICWFTRKKLDSIKLALREYIPLLDGWLNGDNIVE
jgi:8-oxo-dGTP pyrophosphatase MutT (NUDIX family)